MQLFEIKLNAFTKEGLITGQNTKCGLIVN